MSASSHSDLVILDTIVYLVRKVQWGLTRDEMEKIAVGSRAEAEAARKIWALGPFDEASWIADLHTLAAQGRFPRSGDRAPAEMTEVIISQIRSMQKGESLGFFSRKLEVAVREGVALSIARNGFDLHSLPLPPTLHELIDRGDERPDHVSQERWDRAIASYNHAMTIENSPGAVDPEEYDDFVPEWTEEEEQWTREMKPMPDLDAAEEDANTTYRM